MGSNWPDYASPAIAFGALLVALVSLSISLATYRRAGPDVRAHYWISEAAEPRENETSAPPLGVEVSATNRGLAAVEIGSFILQRGSSSGKTFRWRFRMEEEFELKQGPNFPLKLEAGTTRTWSFGVRQLQFPQKVLTEPESMFRALLGVDLFIQLGNGRTARFRPSPIIYFQYVYRYFKDRRLRVDPKDDAD